LAPGMCNYAGLLLLIFYIKLIIGVHIYTMHATLICSQVWFLQI